MMKFSKDLQNLAVISLITVSIWASIEVYKAYVTPAAPEIYQQLVQPLDPNLDISAFDNLRNRKDYTDIIETLGEPTTTNYEDYSFPPLDETPEDIPVQETSDF